jgi:hypothetical protein
MTVTQFFDYLHGSTATAGLAVELEDAFALRRRLVRVAVRPTAPAPPGRVAV